MGHAIPKIEYKNETQEATTTSGDDTLTGVADTDAIEEGMLIEGVGIPAGTTVVSKTVSTVVMSADATANGTVDIEFLYRIEFDYPPIEENGESVDPKERQSASLSGIVQTSIDFIEAKRMLRFSFLSQSLYEALKEFHLNHAYIGFAFRYYDDKTSGTYIDYALSDLKFLPKKLFPKGLNYVWEVPYSFRRVI